MNTSVSLSSPRIFIPLSIVAALLVLGIGSCIIFKLFTRLRKSRDEMRSESLKEELESGTGHSSVTCCGTVPDSKELKLSSPSITFEAEVEGFVQHYTRLSYDMFTPSPSADIFPARRSSSFYETRSDSLPTPSPAVLNSRISRRASIPAMWSNPRSKWADETCLGLHGQGRIQHSSYRPATSPVQQPKAPVGPEVLRRSVTPML